MKRICASVDCKLKNKPQPIEAFGFWKNGPGGRNSVCKECRRRIRSRAYDIAREQRVSADREWQSIQFDRTVKKSKRYLVTAAQNATPVHTGFLRSLEVMASRINAELIVIPYRYKNPTSLKENAANGELWWGEEVAPYLLNTRTALHKHLIVAADVKMSPTASAPLSGFEALTGAESCILGHPKLQFKTIAVPNGRFPKILTTTGACTRSNYSQTKAGALGAFHYSLGATLVELDGDLFHLRQIKGVEDGSFIDVDRLYTPTGHRRAPPAEALALGDLHVGFTDPGVEEATWGPTGMVGVLNPRRVVLHDVLDAYAVNPHHKGNPFISLAKRSAARGDIEAEVKQAIEYLCTRARGREIYVVPSNHDDMLSRWVISGDWKTDTGNAEFYLKTALAMVRSVRMTAAGAQYADPFRYWVDQLKGKASVTCLDADESLLIAGVECGMHGHQGPNGARGSVKNLARVGGKTITGHGHSPAIEEGHYRVGTSTGLRLEYTHGPSSWLNTHCVIYANGKRSLISVIGNRWRAPIR